MKQKLTIAFFLLISVSLAAQDMRQNAFSSLFSDQKASRVGDAITILVMESSQASNDAQTSTGRSSNLGLAASAALGAAAAKGADISLGTTNDFKGAGSTSASGMVNTKISATIDSELPNGNLLIEGNRKIVINGEEQTVYIKGIVRPADISADNSVVSYNISDAQIVLKGSGSINSSQSPGWLTKFFHWIF